MKCNVNVRYILTKGFLVKPSKLNVSFEQHHSFTYYMQDVLGVLPKDIMNVYKEPVGSRIQTSKPSDHDLFYHLPLCPSA